MKEDYINAKTEEELEYHLISKEEKEKLVEKIRKMSVEEQYANIYIEAKMHTPTEEMIRNTALAEAKIKAKEESFAKLLKIVIKEYGY